MASDDRIYARLTNESIEDTAHPFEFIIPDKKCAYRYTGNEKEEANQLIHNYNAYKINTIIILNWQNRKYCRNTEKILWIDVQDFLCEYFDVDKKFYKALLGNKGFAKCFITAEYLYTVFKNNAQFDYTAIVSSYLKAVEQLTYCVVENELNYIDEDAVLNAECDKALWIKANGKINEKNKETKELIVPEKER